MSKYVVHCKRAPFDVYVGRPSIWGNPFSHLPKSAARFRCATRDEAIERYAEWVIEQPELMDRIGELRGKVLACWCAPQRCHAEVLATLANMQPLVVDYAAWAEEIRRMIANHG